MEKLCFIPIWGKKWWDLKNESWKWERLSVSCTFCVMVKRGYSEAFLVFNTLLASNLEEGVATHSSTLAWRTPWTEEPGGLQSTGPQRAGHDRSDLAHILSWHTSQLSQSYLLPATQLLGNVCHNRRRHRFFFFSPVFLLPLFWINFKHSEGHLHCTKNYTAFSKIYHLSTFHSTCFITIYTDFILEAKTHFWLWGAYL